MTMPERCIPDDGEPSFVLLGRDPQAPQLVEKWARDRKRYQPDSEKPAKALKIANAMRIYKAANPEKGMSGEFVQDGNSLEVLLEQAKKIIRSAVPYFQQAQSKASYEVKPLTDALKFLEALQKDSTDE